VAATIPLARGLNGCGAGDVNRMARRGPWSSPAVAALVSVSVSIAAPCSADDAGGAPDGAPEERSARSWLFAVRGAGSLALFDRKHICFAILGGSVPPSCYHDDVWGYALTGLEVDASLGRPTSRFRWLSSVSVTYGPPIQGNAGALWAGRLATGFQFLLHPRRPSSLLVEVQSGVTYYGVAMEGVSLPMASVSEAIGGRFDHVEILARLSLDSILIESVVGGGVVLGLGF
jgi:hypothetical protein